MKELSGSGGTHRGSRRKNHFLTVNGCSSLTRGSGPSHRDSVTSPRKGVPGSSGTFREERGGRTLGPTAPLSQGIHGSLTYVAIGSPLLRSTFPLSQGNGVPRFTPKHSTYDVVNYQHQGSSPCYVADHHPHHTHHCAQRSSTGANDFLHPKPIL